MITQRRQNFKPKNSNSLLTSWWAYLSCGPGATDPFVPWLIRSWLVTSRPYLNKSLHDSYKHCDGEVNFARWWQQKIQKRRRCYRAAKYPAIFIHNINDKYYIFYKFKIFVYFPFTYLLLIHVFIYHTNYFVCLYACLFIDFSLDFVCFLIFLFTYLVIKLLLYHCVTIL